MTAETCANCKNERCSQHGKPNRWMDGVKNKCDQFCDADLFKRIKDALEKVGL